MTSNDIHAFISLPFICSLSATTLSLLSLFYQAPSPHFISPSATFFLSRLSVCPKSLTFMTRVSVFVRNICSYALFPVVIHLSFPLPALRWRYQYPCHRSDTAHAVSINILQSLILLHLNYLSPVIRLYIFSKPNPKWWIWLLVCLPWIFKSSIKTRLRSTNLACSGKMMVEGCQTQRLPQNWQ